MQNLAWNMNVSRYEDLLEKRKHSESHENVKYLVKMEHHRKREQYIKVNTKKLCTVNFNKIVLQDSSTEPYPEKHLYVKNNEIPKIL